MQGFITEELVRALQREREEAARQAWLASRVTKEYSNSRCWNRAAWRIVPLNLRPAACR
jgi:hypothetical protein